MKRVKGVVNSTKGMLKWSDLLAFVGIKRGAILKYWPNT